MRISVKNLAHFTPFTKALELVPNWGLGNVAFVPTVSLLARQPGQSLNLKDLPVLICQIGLMMSIHPTSLPTVRVTGKERIVSHGK